MTHEILCYLLECVGDTAMIIDEGTLDEITEALKENEKDATEGTTYTYVGVDALDTMYDQLEDGTLRVKEGKFG